MDVDIDFSDRSKPLEILKHRTASLKNGNKHNTGVYFTEVPHDPITGQATIDYKTAEERGYFKIDFLNVNIYKDVRDNQHLDELTKREPIWELLEYDEFTDNLFHLSGHGDVLRKLKPKNLEQLAATLAIIRPAKKHLVDSDWETINKNIWTKPDNNDYYWKKSHAFSYAMAVIVHMNLLCEKLNEQTTSS